MDDKVLSDVSLASSISSPMSEVETHDTLSHALVDFSRNVNGLKLPVYADQVTDSFEEALGVGSEITMLPNYSINPSGHEHGDFLVVDLGGSTLRVAVISIAPVSTSNTSNTSNSETPKSETPKSETPKSETPKSEETPGRGDRISIAVSKKWTVENSFKTVDKNFFIWIGQRIYETLCSQSVISMDSVITTGITWSFPLDSTAYNSANILHMAKGYVVSDEVHGHDLKHLLESTMMEKYGVRANVQSIINDSLAVYSAARFLDSNTVLALVLGTGFNVCCQLPSSAKIASHKLIGSEPSVLFNTEASLFGSNLCMAFSTKYDQEIDSRFGLSLEKSPLLHFSPHMATDPKTNTLFQPFELLTSGRYLPELARLVLVEMVEHKEIFTNQKNFGLLSTPYEGFSGELMCYIAECKNNSEIGRKLEACFAWTSGSVEPSDVVNLQLLVNSIIRRSAFIVAIALVASIKLLVRHNGIVDKNISIGYVGSVMEYFVQLRNMVAGFINGCEDIKAMGVSVRIQGVEESSVVGTAIAAASRSCQQS